MIDLNIMFFVMIWTIKPLFKTVLKNKFILQNLQIVLISHFTLVQQRNKEMHHPYLSYFWN